ncbi:MAG: AtpZ/AtpI family protein [Phycisphaeraceae bacterium]|nr:AtpZ/AtpI family protein [Phycisphaeraceae bacterium]
MSQNPDQGDHEVWREPPPPPPVPNFPEIPESLRQAAEGKKPPRQSPLSGLAAGWAMATDFIVTLIAAWLIGFGVDYWQGTSPWGSLIGVAVGFAYAMYRLVRQSQREEREAARRKK